MLSPRGRLAAAGALFLAWIAWLAWCVAQTRDPVVLSRPQFFVANCVAVLDIGEAEGKPDPRVRVAEVLRPKGKSPIPESFVLAEIAHIDARHGWRGPGKYLVPLSVRRFPSASVHIAPVPMSPGYVPRFASIELHKIGPDAETFAASVMKFAGWSREEYDRRIKSLPTLVRANVPYPGEAEAFANEVGAPGILTLTLGDLRIYPATAEARNQYDALAAE